VQNDAVIDAILLDFGCWWVILVELSIHNTQSLVRQRFFLSVLLYSG